MRSANCSPLVFTRILIAAALLFAAQAHAAGPLLVAYGGHNETVAPWWVGIEKGLFKKYGVDPQMLQVRSGQIIMTTLATGGAPVVWPSPSSVLSAAVGGLKIVCIASGSNKIPRELVVRKGIDSLQELRGKIFGVQSIGGGFWLQTMAVIEGLGLDPDKYQLKIRVVGDTGTATQALMSGNIDAAVLPYSFADVAKRGGAHSLADSGQLKLAYQGPSLCTMRESTVHSAEMLTGLLKGFLETLVYIQEPVHKRDVMEILKKNLRLSKEEETEASYNVLRIQMTTLDVAPNLDAWRAIQRTVSRINAKVQEADLDQILVGTFVRNLEESGFLPEIRKRMPH
jgi:ABC-type nitrate/sulfonate/bicarbonate transport system substrate-binding protein